MMNSSGPCSAWSYSACSLAETASWASLIGPSHGQGRPDQPMPGGVPRAVAALQPTAVARLSCDRWWWILDEVFAYNIVVARGISWERWDERGLTRVVGRRGGGRVVATWGCSSAVSGGCRPVGELLSTYNSTMVTRQWWGKDQIEECRPKFVSHRRGDLVAAVAAVALVSGTGSGAPMAGVDKTPLGWGGAVVWCVGVEETKKGSSCVWWG
jgi:hypothetical protein